jgi:hypothetical protein
MKNSKLNYCITVLIVIILGIISRKISLIPLFVGDLLYAVMIFFILKTILSPIGAIQITILALLICYGIEFFQLYQANWIITIRKTLVGRYVLGQGFLWSDILAYTFGIAIARTIDFITFKEKQI